MAGAAPYRLGDEQKQECPVGEDRQDTAAGGGYFTTRRRVDCPSDLSAGAPTRCELLGLSIGCP